MNIISRIDRETGLVIPEVERKQFATLDSFGHLRKNTLIAYQTDVSLFCYWLLDEQPPIDEKKSVKMEIPEIGKILSKRRISEENIVNYIQEIGFQFKISTVYRKIAAISWALKELEKDVVTQKYKVKNALKNLQICSDEYRGNLITAEDVVARGYYPPTKKPEEFDEVQAPAMLFEHLVIIIDYLDKGDHKYTETNVLRIKTMLLVWWHGAFRISEVANLRRADVSFEPGGMKILTRNTKTDKSGKGLKKPFIYMDNPKYCAINHLKQWFDFLGNSGDGFLFKKLYSNNKLDALDRPLTGRAFSNMLKSLAENTGMGNIKFQGHSPRRGFVTEAWNRGARAESIKIMGWKSNTWERYVDDMDDLNNHPMKGK